MRNIKIVAIAMICFCLFACDKQNVDSVCKNAAIKLEKIKTDDQNDRKEWPKDINDVKFLNNIIKRDQKRREKVAIIFADGCFKSAKDYANAAIVFQHGSHPDHFYQAYLWAKKAVALGNNKQRVLMADAIDRYLINIGYKQLFGTQAQMPSFQNPNSCYCLQEIESNFSDATRLKYFGRTFKDQFNWIKELNKNKSCANGVCKTPLKPLNKRILSELGFPQDIDI